MHFTFTRYTEKARRAIFFARYEASQLPTGFIETEHLLLGLIREDVLLRIKLINQQGSEDGLRNELQRAIPAKDQKIATSADLPLSAEAQQVLVRAADAADELNHGSVDSGHLVLGVFAMKGKAAAALDHQGISYETYREALANSPEHSAPEPEAKPEALPEPAPKREIAAPSLRDTISKLKQLVDQTTAYLEQSHPDFADQRLKRKPWTRKEALGHLIDWATVHHVWFVRALTEPRLSVTGYPEDTWVSAQRYAEASWTHLGGLWTSLNGLLIHVLAGLPEEKLGMSCRIGIEPPIALKELIDRYIEHCEDIIGQILAHG